MATTSQPGTRNYRALFLTLASFALGQLAAHAQQIYTANFDDLTEGTFGTTLTDGGLTFSDLDQNFSGLNPPGTFVIENASGVLSAPFTPPNALGFGGYVPGPGAAFGRFGSCWIDFNGVGSAASLDLFTIGPFATLSLEAWNGSTMVASVSGTFNTTGGVQSLELGLIDVAPFDRLEVVSSGPDLSGSGIQGLNGASGLLFDNVTVTTIPEPTALLLLPQALVAGLCLRHRHKAT